ncbi:MAG: amino acid adenylation domain-containing protein [Cyanobacteria bacterium J06649_4]
MSPVNSPDISSLTAEQKRELLAQLMRRKAAQETATKQAKPSTKSDTAPLSFAQQRLWFVDQLQPGQTVYTIPAVLRLQGDLQIDVLQRCLDEIVARHEILRTQFVTAEGNPVQRILPTQKIELSVVELSSIEALSTGSPSSSKISSSKNGTAATENQGSSDQGTESDEPVISQLRPYIQTLIADPFDLESRPLLRSHLIKLSDQDHILAVTVHHIVADYWSLKVLMKEIALLYQAFVSHQPSPLPELPIQYGDYAAWQHSQQDNAETQLNYWLNQLSEPPAVLQLPTDHPRPALQSFNGARHNFSLSSELSQAISKLSQRSQATVFMTLLAAFKVLLSRYSGQADILVGSTVSNRDRTETKDLIGLFVNNLVFRSNLTAEQTFEQLLQQVKETALAAYSHKDIPFEQVVDALKVERQLSHNALFQVMFILHNTPTSTFTLPALTISALDLNNNASRFDLSLDMYENDTGLTGVFEYSTDLFEASTIARMAAHFETLLAGIVASPDAPVGSLPLLSESEVNELNSWNQTTVEIPSQCAHQLIEIQAKKTPEAIALSTDHIVSDNVLSQFFLTGQPWTYHQLNNRANQLACYLSANSVQPGDRIALAMGRSVNLVIAILATLKLGAIYIPLDPTHPSLRLAHILKDSQATLILDSDASLKALDLDVDIPILDIKNQAAEIDQHSTENLSVAVNPQELAYIIYTSGSTGKPKGVPIRHQSLVNLLTSMAKVPGIDSEDSFLAVTTVAFDIATLELLLPLTVGARLVIASSETVRDSDRIITQLENDEITIMQATPATWRMLLDSGWKGSQNLKIFCGGEALDLPLAQQLLPCCKELWNLYGPTETTIWSAAIQIDKEILAQGFVPIGSPIDNTQFYIIDNHGQLVPQGTPGELHIGGAGLSTGYLNRPNLTAEKFITLSIPKSVGFPALNPPYNLPPHHSLRLYKTGDLVRYHQNNTLEYLGRLDHQIKLRGFRIELGEIEAVLNNHDDVDQSLVMLRHDDNGEPQLVAYCKVWADVDVENPSNIRQHISSQLPTYMVPTAYVLLLDFPLTPNGKIDRKALPEPTVSQPAAESRSPQTQTEQQLATIWTQTLNLSTIHATDNFFDLGGHSLLAARVVAQLQPTFGVSVPLRSLFESPILSDFAAAIDAAKQDDGFTPIQIIDREQPLPLSYAQQRQWVLSQLEPDNPFYNIPAALRLEENLSLPLLKQSLAYLCQRHEELRTTFTAVNGEAQLSILPTVAPEISYVDARESDLSTSQIKDRLREAARKPFNLETAPLLRVEVIQAQENLHYILLVVHHIISDATSVEVLMKEIVHVYSQLSAGEAVSLPPLPTGYVDYAAWQRELNTTDQLAYWKEQLKDIQYL